MSKLLVPIFAAALSASSLRAQAPPFPSPSPLAAAEAHGRMFDTFDEVPLLPRWARSGEVDLEGSSERICVEVPQRRGATLRSGEMILGGAIGYPTPNGRLKVWWRPLKSSEGMTLSVVGQKVGTADALVRYRTSGPTISSSSGDKRPDDLFFPGYFEFSSPGKWIVVGTTGAQWGCFVFDLPAWDSLTGGLSLTAPGTDG